MLKRALVTCLIAVSFLVIILLRFYGLGSIPEGLNIDEASYGYDAFSLLKTGKDYWGNPWPLTLKSFGEYRPATLSYAVIPAIQAFGLTALAVRLPSALAGLLTVVTLFYILQVLKKSTVLNLSLAFVYALSPWAFGISRLFYEANVGLLFFALGFLFSLKYLKSSESKYFVYSSLIFAFAGFWYVSLLFIGLSYLASIILLRFSRRSIIALAIIFLPILFLLSARGGLNRLSQESTGQNYAYSLFIDENRSMCYLSSDKNILIGKLCAVWWNKPAQRLEHIGKSFLYQLSLDYLFLDQTQPDVIPKYSGPYVWILSPLYLLGIYVLLSGIINKKRRLFYLLPVIAALIFGNIPAAIAGSPQLHRNVVGLFMAFVVIAMGTHFLIDNFKSHFFRNLAIFVFTLVLLFQTSQFLVYYFAVYTKLNHELWRYDSAMIFTYAKTHASEYDQIWFHDFEDAPLYYAFYTGYDPARFQAEVTRSVPDASGWVHHQNLGKVKSVTGDINSLLCAAQEQKGQRILLLTSDYGNMSGAALYWTRDFTDIHTIHEAYDLSRLNTVKSCPDK